MELKNTAVTIGLTQKERDELERQINEHDRRPIVPPLEFIHFPAAEAAGWDGVEVLRQYGGSRCVVLNPKALPPDDFEKFFPAPEEYGPVQHIPMIACSNELTPAQYKSEKLRRDRDAYFCGRGNFLFLHPVTKNLLYQKTPCAGMSEPLLRRPWTGEWYLLRINTTGGEVSWESILALRLAKMRDLAVQEEQTILIRQDRPVRPDKLKETGVTEEELRNGVSLAEAMKQLTELAENTPVIFWTWHELDFLLMAGRLCGLDLETKSRIGWVALSSLKALVLSYTGKSAYQHRVYERIRSIGGLSGAPGEGSWLLKPYATTRFIFEELTNRYGVNDMAGYHKLCGLRPEDAPLLFDFGVFHSMGLTGRF